MQPPELPIKPKYIYTALIVYWFILLAATSLPTTNLPDVGGSDKVKHFSAYAILAVLITMSMQTQRKSSFFRNKAYFFSVLTAIIYGLLDEIHQSFIPGRYCELWDWIADFGGALAGTIIVYIFNYNRQSSKRISDSSGNPTS